ncbi:uncharacterized protein LACBIDRAFT_314576 [Laccaria bicolor S238N-H82]|uniref:Predicted protein n=1 Tax=Laccaria bicolor (strain S238N-H82 / ATCC MYA-4686) TaxID=486041 RepID=B0DYU3_LACBS|nr:uncharacterized protein LACBIDRAFT_314576 [Laccaria bicolor S238N-H82]EDR00197.1 predicted protein [Laccaria bicolor S238N-H82]|eukprot:XP_001889106.1 predicted protein [Laccaria bicolor S238N-H82]
MAITMCRITSPESYETPQQCCHLSPAIPRSIHLGFYIPSSPAYPKQIVRRYLTSPQLVFAI